VPPITCKNDLYDEQYEEGSFFNELIGKAKCQNIMDTLPLTLPLENVKKEN